MDLQKATSGAIYPNVPTCPDPAPPAGAILADPKSETFGSKSKHNKMLSDPCE